MKEENFPKKKTWLYRIGWPVVWVFCKLVFRLKIIRQAPALPDGAMVLCGNHLHALDPLPFSMITRRQIYYMSKKEVFQKRFLGWLVTQLGAYPVDREGNDIKSVRHTLSLLKKGGVIGIFPEGTRSKDGEVHAFHSGAAMFALRTGAALVPVGFCGTFKPFSKLVMIVGAPMDLSAYMAQKADNDTIAEVTQCLRARVMELVEQAKQCVQKS